jgi:hypothetical protein
LEISATSSKITGALAKASWLPAPKARKSVFAAKFKEWFFASYKYAPVFVFT